MPGLPRNSDAAVMYLVPIVSERTHTAYVPAEGEGREVGGGKRESDKIVQNSAKKELAKFLSCVLLLEVNPNKIGKSHLRKGCVA